MILLFVHRWSQYFLRSPKHIRTYRDVHLLFVGRIGTRNPEISVVEEIFDNTANDPVFGYHDTRFPIIVRRLRLSKSICLVYRYARCHVLLLIQRILQTIVHKTKTKGKTTIFYFYFFTYY